MTKKRKKKLPAETWLHTVIRKKKQRGWPIMTIDGIDLFDIYEMAMKKEEAKIRREETRMMLIEKKEEALIEGRIASIDENKIAELDRRREEAQKSQSPSREALITLYFELDLSHKKIADLMDVSSNTVRTWLQRQNLRKQRYAKREKKDGKRDKKRKIRIISDILQARNICRTELPDQGRDWAEA